ncbi:MAG: glycosyltransferase family 2 protein [Candidatus Omnitrophica bacterium]|nr:glycosyltransferase family 2 protein [Candidatus Omnitrophota bacterium]
MWNQKKVSVVLPTYNEEENIYNAINDFFSCDCVDELIVVNNNSTDNTVAEIKKTKAILVNEKRQGFGFAVQRCLREASGDYIILCEPDGTFIANDIYKLLNYTDYFDLVLGGRTARSCIWTGANMGFSLRWGNHCVAKLLEYLFNGPSMLDVGCTMRLIKRETLDKIKNKFTVGGSHFLPEMVILAILEGSHLVEIPVNYCPRKGESKITGDRIRVFIVGFKMISLIFKYRLKNLFIRR